MKSSFQVHWSRGEQVLRDPIQNKDAAFTHTERTLLGIEGMLPPAVLTIEQQVEMELARIFAKQEPLERYIGLTALLDRNITLFYRLLIEHLDRLAPIVYTPTVGLACQRYSHIYRRPRGLFLTPEDRGKIATRLQNFRQHDVRLIVVTDNERILGLGDQGAGGMGIPVGKLVLYSAGAGIHPTLCLPICLDVGTDNSALLEDPVYMGYRSRRLRGPEYDAFIEEFVQAVKLVFPRALLQWEDFKKNNAFRLLERYVNRIPSFNDDIQGTAGVTLAGVLAALKQTKQNLVDQRFMLVGSGAAGVGIGRLLRTALRAEGLTDEQIRQRQIFIDSNGLVWDGRGEMDAHKREFALKAADLAALGVEMPLPLGLESTVGKVKPTVLIGTTGTPGDFTSGVIRTMASHCKHPIIFPLSNPTSQAECTPSEALLHSDGRALVATGSPFEPVRHNGELHTIGQCNNVFIFPGVGLGALVSEASKVTNSMFLAAAKALAAFTCEQPLPKGCLYPRLEKLREISRIIAFKVAQVARDEGLGRAMSDSEIEQELNEFCWYPRYGSLESEASEVGTEQGRVAMRLAAKEDLRA